MIHPRSTSGRNSPSKTRHTVPASVLWPPRMSTSPPLPGSEAPPGSRMAPAATSLVEPAEINTVGADRGLVRNATVRVEGAMDDANLRTTRRRPKVRGIRPRGPIRLISLRCDDHPAARGLAGSGQDRDVAARGGAASPRQVDGPAHRPHARGPPGLEVDATAGPAGPSRGNL